MKIMRASNYVPYKKSGSHPDPDFYDYVYGDDDNDDGDDGDGGNRGDGSDGGDSGEGGHGGDSVGGDGDGDAGDGDGCKPAQSLNVPALLQGFTHSCYLVGKLSSLIGMIMMMIIEQRGGDHISKSNSSPDLFQCQIFSICPNVFKVGCLPAGQLCVSGNPSAIMLFYQAVRGGCLETGALSCPDNISLHTPTSPLGHIHTIVGKTYWKKTRKTAQSLFQTCQ